MSENGFILYARPSFFEGLSRLIDYGGTLNIYNISRTPQEADFKAIQSDWEAVGMSILLAEKEFKNSLEPVKDHE